MKGNKLKIFVLTAACAVPLTVCTLAAESIKWGSDNQVDWNTDTQVDWVANKVDWTGSFNVINWGTNNNGVNLSNMDSTDISNEDTSMYASMNELLYSGGDMAAVGISSNIERYADRIEYYAQKYGIERYIKLIKAVAQQESGGVHADIMQAAECPYNNRFPSEPNGIKDIDYSLQCGIHYLADALDMAGVESPNDLTCIKLALQGYNYGLGFIPWAQGRGGYSKENAKLFSAIQCNKLGRSSYGDSNYPQHVFHYYKPTKLWSGMNPDVQNKMNNLLQIAHEEGMKIKVVETLRSEKRQNELYSMGRTVPGDIVTNAEYPYSYHNWGLAFDVIQDIVGHEYDGDFLDKIGQIGKDVGLEWGGDWSSPVDKCHFQIRSFDIFRLVDMYGTPKGMI